ncbi:MAG TPA: VOC family protein [Pirellulales bacterium]|jgi:predicted 3-demethylubiquinone-9 3-methyltransferase (glyoxalase superfamily)|nr:VOC family protein [Pirellulales bacterium]
MQSRIKPFLMFQGNAEEAMQFYVSLFPDSEITNIVRYGPGQAGADGSVMKATFSIGGQAVMCIDSPIKHDFGFTPAFSFFVECESEEQLGRLASALGEGGVVLMPLGDYTASVAGLPGSTTVMGSRGR